MNKEKIIEWVAKGFAIFVTTLALLWGFTFFWQIGKSIWKVLNK